MCQSMFDRLLALFMAVILLMALISAGFSVFSIRGAMVNSRMEGLLVQAREIAYLAVHSVLHLLGYDHLDEGPMKRQMREREEKILTEMGLDRT